MEEGHNSTIADNFNILLNPPCGGEKIRELKTVKQSDSSGEVGGSDAWDELSFE